MHNDGRAPQGFRHGRTHIGRRFELIVRLFDRVSYSAVLH